MKARSSATRPRVRPAFRYLAIFSFAVLVPLAAHALWDHVELRRLVREIQAIQARGEPVTERAAGLTYRGTNDEHRRASQYYLAAGMLAAGHLAAPELTELRESVAAGAPLRRSREEIATALRRIREQAFDALTLADRAGELEFRGFMPGTAYNYRAAGLASLSQLISARTANLTLAGEGDQAVNSAVASLHARRVLRDTRWLTVGDHHADIVLSFSSPSAAALQRLQAALEEEEAAFDPAGRMIGDRARAIESVWHRYYGPDPSSAEHYSLPRRSVTETVYRPWISRQAVSTLRQWADVIALARSPWAESAGPMQQLAVRLRNAPGRHAPLILEPFYRGSVIAAADPTQFVRDRCARVAVAVERYRRDHAGALPEVLSDLVPAYLAEVPEDPLSGAPLRYSTHAGAYTIYSVGLDREDDGGDLASELHAAIERGWGRREIRGRDIGVRVLVH